MAAAYLPTKKPLSSQNGLQETSNEIACFECGLQVIFEVQQQQPVAGAV